MRNRTASINGQSIADRVDDHRNLGRRRLPRYTYPAYAIYPDGSEVRADLQAAIEGLKQVVR